MQENEASFGWIWEFGNAWWVQAILIVATLILCVRMAWVNADKDEVSGAAGWIAGLVIFGGLFTTPIWPIVAVVMGGIGLVVGGIAGFIGLCHLAAKGLRNLARRTKRPRKR